MLKNRFLRFIHYYLSDYYCYKNSSKIITLWEVKNNKTVLIKFLPQGIRLHIYYQNLKRYRMSFSLIDYSGFASGTLFYNYT